MAWWKWFGFFWFWLWKNAKLSRWADLSRVKFGSKFSNCHRVGHRSSKKSSKSISVKNFNSLKGKKISISQNFVFRCISACCKWKWLCLRIFHIMRISVLLYFKNLPCWLVGPSVSPSVRPSKTFLNRHGFLSFYSVLCHCKVC